MRHRATDPPGGSLLGALTGAEAADFSKFCSYFPPSDQDNCNSTYSGLPAASLKTAMPTYKNVVVTYTAIDGDEALVNVIGTICDPNQTPSCLFNKLAWERDVVTVTAGLAFAMLAVTYLAHMFPLAKPSTSDAPKPPSAAPERVA
jgi:hypothetical protein